MTEENYDEDIDPVGACRTTSWWSRCTTTCTTGSGEEIAEGTNILLSGGAGAATRVLDEALVEPA